MTDFADLEETEDASWLRLDAQLDPILEHQTEMISAYARIAKVVSAIVGRSSELRPALKVALIKVLEKDVMKPYLQLPQEISFPPSAPEIKSEAELEAELEELGWFELNDRVIGLNNHMQVLAVGLQALATVLETLEENVPDEAP